MPAFAVIDGVSASNAASSGVLTSNAGVLATAVGSGASDSLTNVHASDSGVASAKAPVAVDLS